MKSDLTVIHSRLALAVGMLSSALCAAPASAQERFSLMLLSDYPGSGFQDISPAGTFATGLWAVAPFKWDIGNPGIQWLSTSAPNSCYYTQSPLEVNDLGVVVGKDVDSAGVCQPVKWADGVKVYLPGTGVRGLAMDINNAGVTVGQMVYERGWGGAAWVGDIPYKMRPENSHFCGAVAINDLNIAVGRCGYNGVRWDLNQRTFEYLSEDFVPTDLNNAGVAVGWSKKPGYLISNATMWQDGVLKVLPTVPGAGRAAATGINSAGVIVGEYKLKSIKSPEESVAWIHQDGVTTELDNFLAAEVRAAGWRLVHARGISDDGKIVGKAFNDKSRQYAAFMLTPMPLSTTSR